MRCFSWRGFIRYRQIKKEDKRKITFFLFQDYKNNFCDQDMKNYFSPNFSSETVSFFLPFALLVASTLRPFAEAILSRNPCLFFLFVFDG